MSPILLLFSFYRPSADRDLHSFPNTTLFRSSAGRYRQWWPASPFSSQGKKSPFYRHFLSSPQYPESAFPVFECQLSECGQEAWDTLRNIRWHAAGCPIYEVSPQHSVSDSHPSDYFRLFSTVLLPHRL